MFGILYSRQPYGTFYVGYVRKNGREVIGIRVSVNGTVANFLGYESARSLLKTPSDISLLISGYEEGRFSIPRSDLNSYSTMILSEGACNRVQEIVRGEI